MNQVYDGEEEYTQEINPLATTKKPRKEPISKKKPETSSSKGKKSKGKAKKSQGGSGSDTSAVLSASEGSGNSIGSARSKGSAKPKKGGEKKVEDIGIRERYGNKGELFRSQKSGKPESHEMIEISDEDDEGEAEWEEEETVKINHENEKKDDEGEIPVSPMKVVPSLPPMKPIQKRVEEESKSPLVESPESKHTSPSKPEVRQEEDFVEYEDEEWTNEDWQVKSEKVSDEKVSDEGVRHSPPIHQPMQHHMDEEAEHVSKPPPPGSMMREFVLTDLETLIDEVFREADRTMEGENVTQYSVWATFKKKLRQMIKECYSMRQLKELLKKARAEIETFSAQEPPSRNWIT